MFQSNCNRLGCFAVDMSFHNKFSNDTPMLNFTNQIKDSSTYTKKFQLILKPNRTKPQLKIVAKINL